MPSANTPAPVSAAASGRQGPVSKAGKAAITSAAANAARPSDATTISNGDITIQKKGRDIRQVAVQAPEAAKRQKKAGTEAATRLVEAGQWARMMSDHCMKR